MQDALDVLEVLVSEIIHRNVATTVSVEQCKSLSSEIIGPGQGVVALAHQATLVDLVGSSLTSVFSQKAASILP